MKKMLGIFLIISCFIGLSSLLRIHAQQRDDIIQTAALHDQSGSVVKSITSHQPQDLQLALTVKLPAGETVMTLAKQDSATLVQGEITDVQPQQDVTAKVDKQQQLILQNDQDKAQTVDMVVPLKIADPLLVAKLQLELEVVDAKEKFTLPEVTVKSDDATSETPAVDASDSSEDDDKNSSNDKVSTSSNDTDSNSSKDNSDDSIQVTSSSESTSQTDKSEQAKTTEESTETTKSADNEEDTKKASTTKTSGVDQDTDTQKDTLSKEVPTASIPVHRGQIQMDSWSSGLEFGGSFPTESNVAKKELGVDGIEIGTYHGNNDNVQKYYYYSYHTNKDKGGERAYTVGLGSKPNLKDETLLVYYDNVGAYTTSASIENPDQQMGAIVEISDVEYLNNPLGTPFIDFPNNFYSGVVYNGIKSFNIDVTFTTKDWTKALEFPGPDSDDEYNSYFTFGSLNGNKENEHEWAGTRSSLKGKLAPGAFVHDHNDGWYEGTGVGLTQDDPGRDEAHWGDYLGSADYELGAVSFPMVGTTQLFKLKSDSGFTWQSFSSGYVVPLEQPAPQKNVHRTDELGLLNNDLNGKKIDRDDDDISKLFYTIYQPTYSIPNESIAKPNAITMWDKLPAGLTVTEDDIELFDTNGDSITKQLKKKEDDAKDKGQEIKLRGEITIKDNHIKYELSKAEIEALTFDGNAFAIQITAKIADDFVGTVKNRAAIKFDSGENLTWKKRTNKVVTHFYRGGYQFQKIDRTTEESLAGAEFIIQNSAGKYLTFDDNGHFKAEVAQKDQATQLKGDTSGNFKVTGLPDNTYTLIETKAPDGYVIGDPTEFKIPKDTQTESNDVKQIPNDPYTLPVTGGQGIIWFLIIGLTLTLSALAIWRTHPRGG
ncbi:SpaA isopeptide-forming pilin-related protein [Levilactobacillus cerevisiae]|uniref:SpaA isopeptide-forming pilin-related protein n=1 Tax=Levilactobacillus cerevisiae TaxID=1704076 RepID=UPI000F7AAF6B|nr:SpaA isopeptide-forming pilin-related protein [Levilactobacillus cerevisiae]